MNLFLEPNFVRLSFFEIFETFVYSRTSAFILSFKKTGVCITTKSNQNSSHLKNVFVQQSFFLLFFCSFNPNLCYGNQWQLVSGNLSGIFSQYSTFTYRLHLRLFLLLGPPFGFIKVYMCLLSMDSAMDIEEFKL